MSIIGSNILAGASGQGGGYTIENSLRFRSSASAYLNRTPASAGNRKTWTWSGWVKIGKASSTGLFTASTSGSNMYTIQLNSDGSLNVYAYAGTYPYFRYTSAVFRDYSAWYHFVVAFDSTQATDTDRIKIYVNGVLQTTVAGSGTGWPTLNYDGGVNNTIKHQFSENVGGAAYFDGYLTEVNFIDGQALTPSSFGKTNETTGVWSPIKFNGPWNVGTGVNGFYLPFSDATNTTTLVADSSGNGNDWTPNNISLTSGVTYDSMTDTPTPYEDGGNYCVLNSLNQNSVITLSAGNLSFTASNNRFTTGTFAVTSGKWYWEFYPVAGGASGVGVGAILATTYVFGTAGFANGAGYTGVGYTSNGNKYVSGTSSAYGATYGSGNVIGVALDLDSGTKTITFYKDDISQGSINLPTSSEAWIVATDYSEAGTHSINFGQRPFAYTPPAGFLPLHTGNLPDSTIVDGSQYINAVLWAGDNNARSITGMNFQPDFLWTKSRSTSENHRLMDSVRGDNGTVMYELASNDTSVEAVDGLVSSLDADGFSIAAGGNSPNVSGRTYVGWGWKANGAGVSNDEGSIPSTVSADTAAGFSIVTYTANGVATATIGHGLGATPDMIITFGRTGGSTSHAVYHSSLPSASSSILWLDSALAVATNAGYWNATAPTSTVFSGGASGNYVNNTGWTMVAYCFAEVEGYSKMGKWQNNNSTDGAFVYLGFRPRFILLKNYDNAESWYIWDSVRQTYNVPPPSNNWLSPRLANSEAANNVTTAAIDGLSNGFKIRTTSSSSGEISFGTRNYIYMAFAENPFKNSLAR